MGDITWLPFSIDFLCIAAVSKNPLPIISGHHIAIPCAGNFYNKPVPVLILCIPLLYNKLSNSLSTVTRRLNSILHLLIGEILHM